jgi:hypothetical protein
LDLGMFLLFHVIVPELSTILYCITQRAKSIE